MKRFELLLLVSLGIALSNSAPAQSGRVKDAADTAQTGEAKKPNNEKPADLVDSRTATQLFDDANETAPSLVILEDLDRLYGKNADRANNRTKISLQHLLNCLDGLGSQDGVIVVATANDPTALDPAILRRPGRFDRLVPFGPPSSELRAEYLRRLSRASFNEATLRTAAGETDGFSFAQLREAYILAGQLAFERGDEQIGRADIINAIRLVRGERQAVIGHPAGRGVGFEGPAREEAICVADNMDGRG